MEDGKPALVGSFRALVCPWAPIYNFTGETGSHLDFDSHRFRFFLPWKCLLLRRILFLLPLPPVLGSVHLGYLDNYCGGCPEGVAFMSFQFLMGLILALHLFHQPFLPYLFSTSDPFLTIFLISSFVLFIFLCRQCVPFFSFPLIVFLFVPFPRLLTL